MRTDTFAAAHVPRVIRYDRINPDGRRARIVVRRTEGGSFSVSNEQVAEILDRVGAGELYFEVADVIVSASGDTEIFAIDPGEPKFKLDIK